MYYNRLQYTDRDYIVFCSEIILTKKNTCTYKDKVVLLYFQQPEVPKSCKQDQTAECPFLAVTSTGT